jgi:tetratricopeptide (TPR) repeat protein
MRRLFLPFFHQSNELIRAYVTEMQSLPLDFNDLIVKTMFLSLLILVVSVMAYRGRISLTLLGLALMFFSLSFRNMRHISVFAVLLPPTVLSGAIQRPTWPILPLPVLWDWILTLSRSTGLIVLATLASLLVWFAFTAQVPGSPRWRWRMYELKEGFEPVEAIAWMKQVHLTGRLIHRSEIGGALQANGFDQGQTFADTGFGKFPENFIRWISLLQPEPAALPAILERYHPEIAVLDPAASGWPRILRLLHWRLAFYSPNGSVWLSPELLRTSEQFREVSDNSVEQEFTRYFQGSQFREGLVELTFEKILTLQAMGLEQYALRLFDRLPSGAAERVSYWKTAIRFCRASGEEPAVLEFFYQKALEPARQPSSRVFQGYYWSKNGRPERAIEALSPVPRTTNHETELLNLAQAFVEKREYVQAESLLANDRCFRTSNGERYSLLARVLSERGNLSRAAGIWKRALFLRPDDLSLRTRVREFLRLHPDASLATSLQDTEHLIPKSLLVSAY